MAALQVYEVTESDGKQYVTTTARGVEYTLMPHGDGFGVYSRRLSQCGYPGFKAYADLAAVAANCAAFRDFYAMEAA